ncbi:MAG: beta-lactamase domain protein [Bryobacterales bacterium]|nr:beta-lactamase domain protein [Bryobacterales bacterium]
MRIALLLLLGALLAPAQALRIYAIDTEGGKATLYVSPSGESMLIDTGYDGNDNRDAERIAVAAKAAGVSRINHLVITHFHADHIGGLKPLLAKLPVDHIYDHGATVEPGAGFDAYTAARGSIPHTVLKAGDSVPLKGVQVNVVAADGKAAAKPMAGGGKANPLCASYKAIAVDPGENSHSLALLITFGKLRISDLGDLSWNKEYEVACPVNLVGPVDLYMSTHHGTKTSGPPQIVHALHPRVALMNNGATKGGAPEAWSIIRESPGMTDIWQLHYSNAGGAEHNSPEQFLANPLEKCSGEWLEVIGEKSGTLKITNHRNGFTKTYKR